jgi:hypothetical protein
MPFRSLSPSQRWLALEYSLGGGFPSCISNFNSLDASALNDSYFFTEQKKLLSAIELICWVLKL